MGKIEKKIKKLSERIKYLEDELTLSLTKKTSSTKEIDVGGHQRKIMELRKDLTHYTQITNQGGKSLGAPNKNTKRGQGLTEN